MTNLRRRYQCVCAVAVLWPCVFCSLSLLAQSQVAAASSIPRLVMYSGVAKDASGKALTGTVGVTFAFYKEQEGGSPLWLETQNVQADPRGRFSVYLGATKPDGLPQDLFVSGEARWLGVRPEGQDEQPRVQLITVPYAMKAGDAETIGGLPPSAFVLASPSAASASAAPASSSSSAPGPPSSPPLAGSGTVNFVPLWTPDGNTLGNSVFFQSGTGASATTGVNTSTPAATLDVNGNLLVRGPVQLPATGTANTSSGFNSQPLWMQGSSFNSGTQQPISPTFQWQTEPSGNNTSSPAGSLNLLYGNGTGSPAETGLNIASSGIINFVKTQTFPNTLTGITAGTGVTVSGSKTNPTVGINVTFANQNYAQLKASNTFTASQNVNGTMTATNFSGNGSGLTNVNAGQLGGLGSSAFAQLAQPNTFTANQTVNGAVAATSFSGNGSGLTNLQGGNIQGNVATANNALNLGGLPPSSYQLAGSYATLGANTFSGTQTVNGDVTSTGNVSGAVINATSYSIAGSLDPFLSGSEQSNNAFLGFAGNSTTTGINNIAAGPSALLSNTSGGFNTAVGPTALTKNTTGASNAALGTGALANNTTGGSNTAVGGVALTNNITGSYNTGLGYGAGPDVNSSALTNATAVGAFAVVSKSNALVLGGTGANAVNVGIGTATPNSTLDVHGTGNFTGLISFAPGQTFPGAGTITGVTAGTGLSGGGTSGAVTLNLNSTYTDGRYAQLAANNTFSGVQTINNSVGIGTVPNPAFALQSIGTIRSETGGLSVGGNAPVIVDAPFSPGGRFTILPNGNVGINKAGPTTTLDVGGNINASGGITTAAVNAQGSLSIHGDQPLTAAPHMYFGGFFAGAIAQGQYGSKIRPMKGIIITYMSIIGGQQQIADCNPTGTISIVNQNTGLNLYSLVINTGLNAETSSGPISIPVSGGTGIYLQVTTQPGCGIFLGPNNIQANVEYVMQ